MGSAASRAAKGAADSVPPPKPVDNVPPPKPAKDGSGGNGAAGNAKPKPGEGIPSVTLAPSAIQTALARLDDALIDKAEDFAIEFAQDRLFDALLGKDDNSTTVTRMLLTPLANSFPFDRAKLVVGGKGEGTGVRD